MAAPYAVRADLVRRRYEVYEIASGKAITTFYYLSGKEIDRGVAHGRANIVRDNMNKRARNVGNVHCQA